MTQDQARVRPQQQKTPLQNPGLKGEIQLLSELENFYPHFHRLWVYEAKSRSSVLFIGKYKNNHDSGNEASTYRRIDFPKNAPKDVCTSLFADSADIQGKSSVE